MTKKVIPIIAVVAGVYVAGALIAPYVLAGRAQSNVEHFFTSDAIRQLKQEGIDVSLRSYERGYFSSDAKIRFTWHDKFNGEELYAVDLNTHLTHAPLSLSGFNTIVAKTVQSSKPTGSIGKYVPQDFVSNEIKHGFTNAISGKMTFRPLQEKLDIEGKAVDVDYKGGEIDYRGSPDDIKTVVVDTKMKGFQFVIPSEATSIEVSPYQLSFNIDNGHTGKLSLNKIKASLKQGDNNIHLSAEDVVNTYEYLQTDNRLFPIGFGFNFDKLSYTYQRQYENIDFSAKDADIFIGFDKEGKGYQFKVQVEGEPTLMTSRAGNNQLIPNKVDAEITVSPFDKESIENNYAKLILMTSLGLDGKDIMQQVLPEIIKANAVKHDMNVDIDIELDGKKEKLLDIAGKIQEDMHSEADFARLEQEGDKALPALFHGSYMNIFVSKDYLKQTGLSFMLGMMGIPEEQLYNQQGDIDTKLEIGQDGITLKGEPLPMR